jgi:hypothetical protein
MGIRFLAPLEMTEGEVGFEMTQAYFVVLNVMSLPACPPEHRWHRSVKRHS